MELYTQTETNLKRILNTRSTVVIQLLHMLAGIPAADLDSTITIGDKPPVAIRQLIADYFGHMENHERQARKINH